MSTTIRRLQARDLDFAIEQAAREGWTTSRAWFEALLEHDVSGSFVAELDGRAIAMVTATRYAATGWIGNLITDPEYRARGVGTQLMAIALGHLTGTGARTVRLEADPAGIRIYRKIGFVDEFPSCRFRREVATSDGRDNSSARPLPAAGLPRVAGFDRNAFGDDRGRLIELLHRRAEAAYLVQRRDCITGYALLMPTVQGVHFGPAVADSPDVARQLLEAALRQAEGRTMSLGIPAPNEEGIALVRSLGFTETPSSLRMVRPAPICAGRPTHVFGIASGAFG